VKLKTRLVARFQAQIRARDAPHEDSGTDELSRRER
jgi:hypothetical protein